MRPSVAASSPDDAPDPGPRPAARGDGVPGLGLSRAARGASLRRLRRLRAWTLAVIAAMSLALLAALALQSRQLEAARSSVSFNSDYTVWAFFQLEVEAMNLRERLALHGAAGAASAVPEDEGTRQAFEIFASRIALVRPERVSTGLPVLAGQPDVVADLDAFVARFDPWLSETSQQALTAGVARDAADALARLRPRLRQLSVDIQHVYGQVTAERGAAVQTQLRLSLAVTTLQVAMLLLFVGLLVAHLRALASRQRHLLETLRNLRVAQRASRQASEAKTRFLANMSHEIRTPLQGVLGQLSLLQAEPLAAEPAQHVQVAHESAQQLLAVLNDVIDVSRIDAGRVRIFPVPCRPKDVAAQVLDLLRPYALARGLRLEMQCGESVPELVVLDVVRLRQVLFNLASNAVKFTEQGQVTLTLGARPWPGPPNAAAATADAPAAPAGSHADGRRVLLVVQIEDTGIGMSQDTLAGLFQRFHQADTTIRRRHGGSGLGLEISRNLARLMGGDIAVSSQPGQGSCFVLTLPAEPAEPAPPAARPEGIPPRPERALDVLVADDNAVNRRFIGHALKALGHRCEFASDGEQALALARQRRFDVVLMDLHMPRMDGLSATRALRALDDERAALPVVAITADVLPETADAAADAGVTAMIYKPMRKEDIARQLSVLFPA